MRSLDELLEIGIDVNIQDEAGVTPLHLAIEKGNVTFTTRKKSTISVVPKLELRILHVSCPYVIRNLCSVPFDWLWEKKGSLHLLH